MDTLNLESVGWLLTYGILAMAVVFGVFLVIRQAVLWYFRINEMADDLRYIANHYRAIDQEAGRKRIEETRRTTGAGSPFSSINSRN